MPMNNRLLVPQKLPLLLDYAGGAAAAYSLRSLSNSYVGPVVTVRRSTDNAEADFTSTEVSDGTLAAWCGGGDGFVKQWWSQTGSNHAIAPADTNEPKIVDSGEIILQAGKPAIQFDGSNDFLETASAVTFANVCVFVVYKHKDGGNNWKRVINAWDSVSTDGWFVARYSSTNQIEFRIEPQVADGVITIPDTSTEDDEILIVTAIYAQGTGSIYKNGATEDTQAGLTASFSASQKISIGGRISAGSVAETYELTISELIIYPTDMTALRTRIEGDLAWYY